jgi:hypothetical protein
MNDPHEWDGVSIEAIQVNRKIEEISLWVERVALSVRLLVDVVKSHNDRISKLEKKQ